MGQLRTGNKRRSRAIVAAVARKTSDTSVAPATTEAPEAAKAAS